MQGQAAAKEQKTEGQEEEQEQESEKQAEDRMIEEEEIEEGGDQQVVVAAATMAALSLGEKKGQEKQEDECSVCLKVIDESDTDDPPDPALVCGHRYHAFCLHFWVERYASKVCRGDLSVLSLAVAGGGEHVRKELEGWIRKRRWLLYVLLYVDFTLVV